MRPAVEGVFIPQLIRLPKGAPADTVIEVSGAGTIITSESGNYYVKYSWAWPFGTGLFCPFCLCCTWADRDWNGMEGRCVGGCDYEEAHDHPYVKPGQPYCPACLESHHGWVCPDLTRGLA